MKDLVETQQDFVALKRFDFSLAKVVEKHPDGCSDRLIASALMVKEEEVEQIYQEAVQKLRRIMLIEE